MGWLGELIAWFTAPEQWSGPMSIPVLAAQHLWYAGASLAVAAAIALPLGMWTGHTGRGGALVINLSNVGRAVPSFGIILLVVTLSGIGFLPVLVALVAFAIPPMVTNAYTALREVDGHVRDAAEGLGMRPAQVLAGVELPLALPLIMAGVRTSAVQVVATATLAAVVGLGGFGRYIVNGLAVQDFTRVVAGALLAATLALAVEVALAGLQRLLVRAGIDAPDRERVAEAKVEAQAS